MTSLTQRFVAEVAPLPVSAQLAFASNPSLIDELCQNPDLDPQAWDVLWATKLPADAARHLVGRPLDPERVEMILTMERRTAVLEDLLHHNQVPDGTPALLKAKRLTPRLSQQLYKHFQNTPAAVEELAPRLAPLWRLTWLAESSLGDVSDDVVLMHLNTLDTWWDKTKSFAARGSLLGLLFGKRPHLVPLAVHANTPEAMKSSLAGNKDLLDPALQRLLLGITPGSPEPDVNDFVLLAFVNNPRADMGVIDQVAASQPSFEVSSSIRRRQGNDAQGTISVSYAEIVDQEVLAWLVRRSTPFEGRDFSRKGRPFDLAELARNPNLDDQLVAQVVTGVVDLWSYGDMDPVVAADAACALIANFPSQAGALACVLETRQELLSETTSTAAPAAVVADFAWIASLSPERALRESPVALAHYLTDLFAEDAQPWVLTADMMAAHPFDSTIEQLALTAKRLVH